MQHGEGSDTAEEPGDSSTEREFAWYVTNARALRVCPAAGTGSGVSMLKSWLPSPASFFVCLHSLKKEDETGRGIHIYSRLQPDWIGKKKAYSRRQLARPGWPAGFNCVAQMYSLILHLSLRGVEGSMNGGFG